jgi:hypothetical protein
MILKATSFLDRHKMDTKTCRITRVKAIITKEKGESDHLLSKIEVSNLWLLEILEQ